MDGENNGKPFKMDDLGVPLFVETAIYWYTIICSNYSDLTRVPISPKG